MSPSRTKPPQNRSISDLHPIRIARGASRSTRAASESVKPHSTEFFLLILSNTGSKIFDAIADPSESLDGILIAPVIIARWKSWAKSGVIRLYLNITARNAAPSAFAALTRRRRIFATCRLVATMNARLRTNSARPSSPADPSWPATLLRRSVCSLEGRRPCDDATLNLAFNGQFQFTQRLALPAGGSSACLPSRFRTGKGQRHSH